MVKDINNLIIAEVSNNRCYTFFHRLALPGTTSEEDLTKKVKDLQNAYLVMVWEVPSLEKLIELETKLNMGDTAKELDTLWGKFFEDFDKLRLSCSNLTMEVTAQKIREFMQVKFTSNLCGQYPFAQKKLLKYVRNFKDGELSQLVIKEAIRLIDEVNGSVILQELYEEAGIDDPVPISSQTSMDSSGGGDVASSKKASGYFSKIKRRLIGSKEPSGSLKDSSSASSVNSPQIPPRTLTPPSITTTTQTQSSSSAPKAISNERVCFEVQHVKMKATGKQSRVPVFLAIMLFKF